MEGAAFVAAFAASYVGAPPLARRLGAPLITVHLLLGLLAQTLGGAAAKMPRALEPAHNAALACITLAAGSELVVASLVRNARAIARLSLAITLSTLVVVSVSFVGLSVLLPSTMPAAHLPATARLAAGAGAARAHGAARSSA